MIAFKNAVSNEPVSTLIIVFAYFCECLLLTLILGWLGQKIRHAIEFEKRWLKRLFFFLSFLLKFIHRLYHSSLFTHFLEWELHVLDKHLIVCLSHFFSHYLRSFQHFKHRFQNLILVPEFPSRQVFFDLLIASVTNILIGKIRCISEVSHLYERHKTLNNRFFVIKILPCHELVKFVDDLTNYRGFHILFRHLLGKFLHSLRGCNSVVIGGTIHPKHYQFKNFFLIMFN